MQEKVRVCVVDDDETACQTTCKLLDSVGEFETYAFTSPHQFLQEVAAIDPCCIVMDMRMPGMTGAEVQQKLLERDVNIPILVLTGYADVPTAVTVMKQGAETLIEKPYEPNDLIEKVREAVEKRRRLAPLEEQKRQARQAMERLSEEEREIMNMMVTGAANKVIASKLSLSPRTLDRRRSQILEKMGVASVPELANLIGRLNAPPNNG